MKVSYPRCPKLRTRVTDEWMLCVLAAGWKVLKSRLERCWKCKGWWKVLEVVLFGGRKLRKEAGLVGSENAQTTARAWRIEQMQGASEDVAEKGKRCAGRARRGSCRFKGHAVHTGRLCVLHAGKAVVGGVLLLVWSG